MHEPTLTNSALLLLRVFLGSLLAAHGGLKFLQRGGLDSEVELLIGDGLRGGRLAAAFSGLTQVGAGALLTVGFVSALAGAAAIGAMVVAVLAKVRNGFWFADDGAEFPLIFATMAVTVTLAGPGQWSLDAVLGVTPQSAETIGALILGLISGAAAFVCLRDRQSSQHNLSPAASSAGGPQQQNGGL